MVTLLVAAGYTVGRIAAAQAVAAALDDRPDAMLVDIGACVDGGAQVCRALRAASDVPILALGGYADEADLGLVANSGADVFLCEPIESADVLARLHALIARRADEPSRTRWRVDHDSRTITRNGTALELTPVEFRLLSALIAAAGAPCSRSRLLDCAHAAFRDAGDRAIDEHIRNLRRKIAAIAPGRDVIVSVYGVGYRIGD